MMNAKRTKALRVVVAAGIVLTLVASLVIGVAGAGRTESGDVVVEAETMALDPSQGAVYSDGEAHGGEALLIWTNGAAKATVTIPATEKVVVRAKGDQCGGAPEMVVKVDGTVIERKLVKATWWVYHRIDVALPKGTHDVTVGFSNDYRNSSCDRNLRVDRVAFHAAPEVLYVEPDTAAKRQADEWRSSRPADAAQMDKIANNAQAIWFGEWSGDVSAAVDAVVTAADGRVPVLVAYNIPNRDCGGYSSGGISPDGYRSWIRAFADGIGDRRAVVVLEPDALPLMDCLSLTDQATRADLLSDTVDVLSARPGVDVYIDAGHAAWLSAAEAASRLIGAGVAKADGFSLNVSNFQATTDSIAYGELVSAAAGGAHFVIDTSRNGLGPEPSGEWCNPSGRALGHAPSLDTGHPLVDAYVWVKRPGESDGTCNGGPSAGQWWADYALGLAERAAW